MMEKKNTIPMDSQHCPNETPLSMAIARISDVPVFSKSQWFTGFRVIPVNGDDNNLTS